MDQFRQIGVFLFRRWIQSSGSGRAVRGQDTPHTIPSSPLPAFSEAEVEKAARAFWEANDEEFRRVNKWCDTEDPWDQADPDDTRRYVVAMKAALAALGTGGTEEK